MRLTGRVEFAAARRGAQDQAIAALRPAVVEALNNIGEEGWWRPLLAPTRALFNETLRTDSGGDTAHDVRGWAALSRMIASTLPKAQHKDDRAVTAIATYLTTAAINAAAIAASKADREPLLLEWVTMHDKDVRSAHAHTDGQHRPPGEPFDVDGVPMSQPGDVSAPIELWINCRCMLRPALASEAASLVAATGGAPTGRVVVALPSETDPARGIGAEDKHMTLAWLGKPEENPNLDMGAVKDHVAGVAEQLPPFASPVEKVAPLGQDGAQVWMHPKDDPGALLAHQHVNDGPVHEGTQAVQQHPQFVPHTTIGYADTPPEQAQGIDKIGFDRLAVWDGEDRTEYPLGGKPMTSTTTSAAVIAGDDIGTDQALAWHGVLVPEGVWSGDGRRFAADSLRFRDLPMPLSWQMMSDDGHKSSVVVAKIEQINRVGSEMRARGHWLASEDADTAIGLVAEFGKFGVSIDADDGTYEFDEETEQVTFTSARIASACLVPIPAFAEAYVALGPGEPDFMPGDDATTDCDPNDPDYDECMKNKGQAPADTPAAPVGAQANGIAEFVSDKPWSQFGQGDYTPQQWKSACILHLSDSLDKSQHKLPIKEPGGALNRNGVHAAASRFGSVQAPAEAKAAAKSSLRGAYKQIGEEPPDAIAAALELSLSEELLLMFKRGPGWITDPEATKRIHDYWTVPGEPGYEKIGWGVAGDFNRCKDEIGQEIAEKDPATVAKWMNNICAQWHHDATGYWPGRAPTEQVALGEDARTLVASATMAPAITMVASVGLPPAPAEWFADPKFSAETPLTITDEGRVFGHLAGWSTCHLDFPGSCVTPPHSEIDYAYFLTGYVNTTAGQVPVGRITMDVEHADTSLRMIPAKAHYDNTATVVADVTCGEDEFGIWLAGRIRPGADPVKVEALRASPISGDWREYGTGMELIAAHAVNTPGFLNPRVGIHDGVQISLVAAGMVHPIGAQVGEFDIDALADKVADKIANRRQRMAALAAKVSP